jgi:hypothetical protein
LTWDDGKRIGRDQVRVVCLSSGKEMREDASDLKNKDKNWGNSLGKSPLFIPD